jgi:hypothetical protein
VLSPTLAQLRHELERQVQYRTGRRVRELVVEVNGHIVVLRGWTPTYHVKQLAQQAVRDLLPLTPVDNGIVVESASPAVR